MEQIAFDDPQDAEIADNVLQHLRHSLQLLASPAQAQLSHFPAGWVVLTDEMVLVFCPGAFDGEEPDPRKGGHYISLTRLIKW